MKRILLLTISIVIPSLSYATNYEDAEDGNTDGWAIYDNNPAGATITNVFDSDRVTRAIELAGDGTHNGYRLGNNSGESDAWNNTEETRAQWSIKDNGFYKVYISVVTENWSGYMYYTPVDFNEGVINAGSTRFIHTGLNLETNNTWKTITRDLQADLHAVEPNNNIIAVNGFFIKGNGRVDDINLLPDQLPLELISPEGNISNNLPTYKWAALQFAPYNYDIEVTDSTGVVIHESYTPAEAGCANGEEICSITPQIPLMNGEGSWKLRWWMDLEYSEWSASKAFNLNQPATLYEDAEDGTTDGWVIYDNNPAGATITNVNDSDKGSQVIEFAGDGTRNGYRLGNNSGESDAWNNTKATKAQWSIKDNGFYKVYISVVTENWSGYMYYTPVDFNEGVINAGSTRFIHTGLDLNLDNTWKTITRDLQADLHAVEPNNNITAVNGFFIKGNGRVDDIKLLESVVDQTIISLDTLKAFPTAEGAGANATGGRGGDVIYVTNRNMSGPGSLKYALKQEGKRTVVFAIGGRFNIDDGIDIESKSIEGLNLGNKYGGDTEEGKYNDLTFAGQTANDKGGVHLATEGIDRCRGPKAGERVFNIFQQDNMILRYFDSRFNWQWYFPSKEEPANHGCARGYNFNQENIPSLRLVSVNDIIIDHITSGWSSYGIIVTNGTDASKSTGNITIQRSLMHEGTYNPIGPSLYRSNQKKQTNHNVGLLLGLKRGGISEADWDRVGDFSVHKNAFIGVSHRFPNTAGGNNATFRVINNYIYGFKGDSTERLVRTGGNSANDFINNVYQNTPSSPAFTISNLIGHQYGLFMSTSTDIVEQPNFYINGNLFIDDQAETLDITTVIQASNGRLMTFQWGNTGPGNSGDNLPIETIRSTPAPSATHPVSIFSATSVKENILSNVGGNVQFNADGSTFVTDSIDNRYLNWAKNNTGPTFYTTAFGDGGLGDHIGNGNTAESGFHYPAYSTAPAVDLNTYDTDRDGMPNTWEIEHGLDPNSPENNEIRPNRNWIFGNYLVKNNAGYTNLEMYLADIGGDFHTLAKEQ